MIPFQDTKADFQPDSIDINTIVGANGYFTLVIIIRRDRSEATGNAKLAVAN